MSTDAMKWAVEFAPPMPAQLVATLTGLAYHADTKGRGAYPSLARLAAYACKSERSVRRDLRDLEDLKLIRHGDQSKAAHITADKRPTVYDLAVENRVPKGRAGDDEGTRTSARTLASARARGIDKRRANKARSEGESIPEREDVDVRADADVPPDVDVTAGGRGRHSGGTWTSAKPKNEPQDEQLPKDSSSPAAQVDEGDSTDHHLEAFGAFWSNYPKKRDREEAKKAWIAALKRGAEPQLMVDAAQAYARERFGKEAQYTKYPATWLNKGCYDDEPDPQGPPLRAVSGGYQPWKNPADQDAYDEPFFD
ncbi:hypothetical protein PV729_45465 [Streptomyces europaeiscabiei]|uniref:Helix-turn-helix domain-containing protein n=1 Tax=Streptomyces europaeiscabiei TaxID=146819 RepID=A0ABU4P0D5_9ACTN|nr:helix-turn-helix domain-containing protein [Streptomyces europaeiscabiei]MDX3544352.1 hypothetical protein [Streptomyces europaeiscabiei]MDX3558825.1 hypothetical protein [Streptomyces europaeiscabiei]MDX3707239.1 hypothetical protein [Streptomyces europaeiscabiei]